MAQGVTIVVKKAMVMDVVKAEATTNAHLHGAGNAMLTETEEHVAKPSVSAATRIWLVDVIVTEVKAVIVEVTAVIRISFE